ncbi:hypothetical protein BFW87_04730 [Pseudomonas fluorescens]|uniref:Uncharacterized protein n=2 Tax=Pseudomonas fluorescens TaxID=294 RepID=A0A1T2Z5C4_PSEFL|nr:hypothetical protein BFW87_04730 [Pseudomonas fluorescens]
MGLVGEALKMGTELVKMATQAAQSQSGNKEGGGDKDKIAHQEMHNQKRVDFGGEGGGSTNHININANVNSNAA